jgi:outer membrane protein OmpA-like peptidoglycan-associated protein
MLLGVFGTFSIAAAESEFKDAPYFTGMPNYKITDATDQDFADYRFYDGKNCTTVEGKKHYRAYTLKENARQASELQISRNYANAIKDMGGTIVFDGQCSGADCAENCGGRMMIGKVIKGGSELWLEIVPFNDGNDYYLTIVAKQAMTQDVTASAMLDALNREGHVALYINFDTGKSIIRPESQPIIDQIVQLMKSNPRLKISVEGHTDNVGNPTSNKALSDNRAKAVVSAIVGQGVDANRLSALGHGQDKPIADNKTEEGRSKNRRVELVKK